MRLAVNGMNERPWRGAGAAGMAGRWLAAGALLALAALPAPAQQALPLPQVDFAAEGTFTGGGRMALRHHGGLLRIEIAMPGVPMPMTGYFDRATGKALMIVTTAAGRVAMEGDLAELAGLGVTVGQGERVGQDTVAGEPCDEWRIDTGRADAPVHTCITADGIALRTDAVVAGKKQTMFEIVSLSRAAQDPAELRLPTDVPVVKLPKSLPGASLPGAPPRQPPRVAPAQQ